MQPEVSVLMAVYNGERYLADSIESILTQTFTNFEFIIVNDGSTDRTSQILTEYSRHDKRIRLIENSENIFMKEGIFISQILMSQEQTPF